MTLSDKFHSYLERYRCAIVYERDLGSDHPETIKSYEISNEMKLELQTMLKEADERLAENS